MQRLSHRDPADFDLTTEQPVSTTVPQGQSPTRVPQFIVTEPLGDSKEEDVAQDAEERAAEYHVVGVVDEVTEEDALEKLLAWYHCEQ